MFYLSYFYKGTRITHAISNGDHVTSKGMDPALPGESGQVSGSAAGRQWGRGQGDVRGYTVSMVHEEIYCPTWKQCRLEIFLET